MTFCCDRFYDVSGKEVSIDTCYCEYFTFWPTGVNFDNIESRRGRGTRKQGKTKVKVSKGKEYMYFCAKYVVHK